MPRRKSTHVDDPLAVGRRLREARERAGLSQRALAFEGCSAAYVSRVESGDRIPSLAVLRELAARLNVSQSWLAVGKEDTTSSTMRDAEIALRLDETEQAEKLFSQALEISDDADSRSLALEGLAQVALRTGDPRRAVTFAGEALATGGWQPEERPTLAETIARAYANLGELPPAIAVLRRCVSHFQDDVVQFVRFSALLGAALTDAGNFAEADSVIGGALARGRAIADPYMQARLYWSQSRLLLEAGRSDAAEEHAERTLEILRATEDGYAIGHILQTLAQINTDLGRAEDALEFLQEGWPMIAAHATPIEKAQFKIEEARALAALGETDRAGALAIELNQSIGSIEPTDSGRAYALLGGIFATVGDRARAREVLELAVELLEQQPPSRYLVGAYKQLAAVLKEEGQPEMALQVLERAIGVQERVGRPLA
jgi:tetratricopeptide (TPR) repeat protein